MAPLIRPNSAELTTSQLDLLSVSPSQTNLDEGSFTEYHPVSVLTSTGRIEFTIRAENSDYINLANTFFYVSVTRASVTVADVDNLAADAEIAPGYSFLHTLWSQIDAYLNGVTQSNNNYPYRAYIKNLLGFGQDAKSSQLSLSCGIETPQVTLIPGPLPTQDIPNVKSWLLKAGKLM